MPHRALSSTSRATPRHPAAAASKTRERPAESPSVQLGPRLTIAFAIGTSLLSDVLIRLIRETPGVKVVGQACDEEAVSQILRRETPQVLLLDFEGAGPNGENVISRLCRAFPASRILVLAERACDENVGRVLRAGGWGLVDKQTSFETLIRAVRSVAQGEVWADPRATARALEYLTHVDGPPQSSGSLLSKRELEIVDCVGRGLRNKEIAHLLSISQKTVKSHLNNIFRKLKLDGRIALALLAHTPGQSPS